MDFLAENNACGQTLLRLVAKGNATIAELLRLKDVIPTVYGKAPSKADAAKYGDLIQADFNYFKSTEQFENRVEQSEHLQQLDDELKENHVDLLKRFYRLFESMHRFVTDLTLYIGDLDDGAFIQQSLETVFLDKEGKQLLVCRILKMLHTYICTSCTSSLFSFSLAKVARMSHSESIFQILRCSISGKVGTISENGFLTKDRIRFNDIT